MGKKKKNIDGENAIIDTPTKKEVCFKRSYCGKYGNFERGKKYMLPVEIIYLLKDDIKCL